MSILKRWIWPGLFVVISLTAIAVWSMADVIEADLKARFNTALAIEDAGWAEIRIDGRDGFISGTAPEQANIDTVTNVARNVAGLRLQGVDADLLPLIEPFTLRFIKNGDELRAVGHVPYSLRDEAVMEALSATLPSVQFINDTIPARGAPAALGQYIGFAGEILQNLSAGTVALSGNTLSVSGEVANFDALERLQAVLTQSRPDGLTLEAIEILPPLIEEYTFSATLENQGLSLEGFAPSDVVLEQVANLAAAALPDGVVTNALKLARGAPEGFAEHAAFALSVLPNLQSGLIALNGSELSISGEAANRAAYARLQNTLTQSLPAGLSLADLTVQPSTAENYFWKLAVGPDGVNLSGSVLSSEERDRIVERLTAELGRSVSVADLFVERGAPQSYERGRDIAVERVRDFENGAFLIDADGTLRISGTARSSDIYAELVMRLEALQSNDIYVEFSNIRPPELQPYDTRLAKRNGGLVVSGAMPNVATREALLARAEAVLPALSVTDDTTYASGAPDGFERQFLLALNALAFLDVGEVRLLDGKVSLQGQPADTAQSEALERFIADLPADIAAAFVNNTTKVDGTPYMFSAEKGENSLIFRGMMPSDDVRNAVLAAAGSSLPAQDIRDEMVLQPPAPTQFSAHVIAAIELLNRLQSGAVNFENGQFVLSGTAKTPLDFDAVQNALSKSGGILGEIAPSAAPGDYLWSAVKREGVVTISGSVPSGDMRPLLTERAQTLFPALDVTATMNVESGAPDGFLEHATKLLQWLTYLKDGEVSLLNGKAAISGVADTVEAFESLDAILAESGFELQSNITPATVSPYTWAISRLEEGSMLTGFVPDNLAGQANMAAAQSVLGGEVKSTLRLALGAPEEFANAVAAAIGAVGQLDESGAKLTDQTVEIFGLASNKARATRIETRLRADLEALGFALQGSVSFPAPVQEGAPEGDPVAKAAKALTAAEKAEMEARQKQAVQCEAQLNALLADDDIRFATSKAVIKQASYPLLDDLADVLKMCGAVKLEIGGHTDDRGSIRYNQGLSEARALSVRKYLEEAGVNVSAISVYGYGESTPRAANNSAAGRSANRRIEFKIAE